MGCGMLSGWYVYGVECCFGVDEAGEIVVFEACWRGCNAPRAGYCRFGMSFRWWKLQVYRQMATGMIAAL